MHKRLRVPMAGFCQDFPSPRPCHLLLRALRKPMLFKTHLCGNWGTERQWAGKPTCWHSKEGCWSTGGRGKQTHLCLLWPSKPSLRRTTNANISPRSCSGGKDTACEGISVCSHLGEMVAVLSVQGPQQNTLSKHSSSLPHLQSSFLITKAARSWKERSSTPFARGKVLPRLALGSDKFAKRPDSRSGSHCSQARQERLGLPSCLSSSAFTESRWEKLCVTH